MNTEKSKPYFDMGIAAMCCAFFALAFAVMVHGNGDISILFYPCVALCYTCIFIGALFFSAGIKQAINKALYNSEESIVFIYFNKRRYKVLLVSVSNLSMETKDVLKSRIEKPLKHLYKLALSSKRAEAVYKSASIYLNTIAEDLKKAISECENQLMEETLVSRLHVVETFIIGVSDDIDEALKTENTEKIILENLKLEGYRPFSLTEELNKLM